MRSATDGVNGRVPEIRIEDALGVCGVREDTQLLARLAADAPRPGRGLDLGTGSGYVAIYLALVGWQVDAVDISPRALELARHNAARNGVNLRIYASDLFSAVEGAYDVIACNPPMRGDETEASRLVTASLRRVGVLANLLMRVTQPALERKRLGFLAELAARSQQHLAPDGRLLLVISPLEEKELPVRVPGLVLLAARPVSGIPGLNVAAFGFRPQPGAAGQEVA
jgi:methylase of polypeptide subunit release factors